MVNGFYRIIANSYCDQSFPGIDYKLLEGRGVLYKSSLSPSLVLDPDYANS